VIIRNVQKAMTMGRSFEAGWRYDD
jgi:hypothetical protein